MNVLGRTGDLRETAATRVAIAAAAGSYVEWFDFFISSTAAALVWPSVFFSMESPSLAFILSASALGTTFFARPIGGAVFGHFGDRVGRKTGVVWTLVLTSVASFGIALSPGFDAAGPLGAVLLFVFRILAGIGLGGDYAGATTWLEEHVHGSKKRGFWGSWLGVVINLGLLSSSLLFSYVAGVLPHPVFLDWGWRTLFATAGVASIVGIGVRLSVSESPLFAELARMKRTLTVPLADVLRVHWKPIILMAVPYGVSFAVVNLEVQLYGQRYLLAHGIPISEITLAVAINAAVGAVLALFAGTISDRVRRGRKWVIVASMASATVFSFAIFPAFDTLAFPTIVLGIVSVNSSINASSGVFPSMFADQFETKYRYSGVGLGSQLGALVTGFFVTPLLPLVTSAYPTTVSSAPGVVGLSVGGLLIGMLCLLLLKEKRPERLSTL